MPGVIYDYWMDEEDMDVKSEAALIKEAFLRTKASEGLSQQAFGDELDVSQSMVGAWFSGRKPVPDDTLLRIGPRLGFDPFAVRPSLKRYVRLISALTGNDTATLKGLLSQLTKDEAALVEKFTRFVVSSREEE